MLWSSNQYNQSRIVIIIYALTFQCFRAHPSNSLIRNRKHIAGTQGKVIKRMGGINYLTIF